jgi:hypothetical protein
MNKTKYSERPMSRLLCGLIFTACVSFTPFQAAEAHSVGGWDQSWGQWEHDGGSHGGCGGGDGGGGLPCGLADQTATFLMYKEDRPEYVKYPSTKNISISYDLTDMIVDSAQLWIKAMDDTFLTTDGSMPLIFSWIKDPSEQAAITSVESTIIPTVWTEIDGYGWYIGLDVTSFIDSTHTSPLTALLSVKNAGSKDFFFKNAKLDVNYHTAPCPPPVPLPAAAWLFGSALLGFVSLSNRRKV